MRVGLWRKLSAKELMLLNCGVGEDSWESLGQQGDPTSPFWRRSALGVSLEGMILNETPVLWPPHEKSWLIGKDSDPGRDCGQEEKGTTEDEMAGWHHGLDGCESEWSPGDGDRQGGLACCNSWGHKESDTMERLNWTELNWIYIENGNCEFMSSQNWKHSLRYRFTQDCKWFIYTILAETVSYHFYLLKDITRLPLSRVITEYLQSNFRFKFCKQSSVFTQQNKISSINVTGNALTPFHCHWRNLKHLLNRFPPRIPFVHL